MRKFFAVVFLLVFWLSLFLSLVFVNVRYSVFSADYLKDALTESNFYSQVSNLIVEDYLDEEVVDKEVSSKALSPEWLEQNLTVIIDAVYGQFLFDSQFSDLQDVYLDVSGPKAILIPVLADYFDVGLPVDQIAEALNSSLPDQINVLSLVTFFSNPQDMEMEDGGDAQEQFGFLESLGEEPGSDSEVLLQIQEQVETAKNLQLIINFVMYLCIALTALSLLGLILLFLFRKPSLLSWLATSTLPPGLGTFCLAGAVKLYLIFNQGYLEKNTDEFMAQAGEFAGPKITLLSIDFLYAYLHPILNRLIIFGLILLVLGILFLILRKVIHKKAK